MFRNSCAKKIIRLSSITKIQNMEQTIHNINPFNFSRGIFRAARIPAKTKEYNGRKIVGFSMQQMYDVVADVGNYKQFVPFCKKSLLLYEKPGFLQADLIIGFPPLTESYRSNVTLVEPFMVKAMCVDGRLFNHLETTWKFSPALKNNPQSCIVDFYVSFEFRSLLHSQLANIFFDKLVQQMEGAFINEARTRFGKESIPSRRLDHYGKKS